MFALDPVLRHISVAAGAIVFFLSALTKFRGLAVFRAAFGAYRLVPARLTPYAAPVIPVLETVFAVGLLCAPIRPFAALGLECLLGVFAVALLVNLLRGNDAIDCGCGGFVETPSAAASSGIGYWHVGRVAALAVLLWPALQLVTERQVFLPDYATVFFAVLFIVGAYYVVDLLLANAPKLKNLGT
jgi:Methylamine utilisation protein MauE